MSGDRGLPPLPDSRPLIVPDSAGLALAGWRCRDCAAPLALDGPWCPRCRGPLDTERFPLRGTVWASTILRVPLPGRPAPTALAYVDLDGGPRLLGHLAGPPAERLRAGTRVRGAGLSEHGDPLFEAIPEEAR
ncbi:Zn-ribbon domain-containing OB-fold protein [Acrocarpospora catenulata]|uniref:Zn-ribbon domain-containing OB-fold protein n=1 Tax=Acrocarpospora catenulata TaxID=2836182 RepID=UPI001BDA925E|nr:OB-fold domain-containing protein [Acrocarpospora catenulata]